MKYKERIVIGIVFGVLVNMLLAIFVIVLYCNRFSDVVSISGFMGTIIAFVFLDILLILRMRNCSIVINDEDIIVTNSFRKSITIMKSEIAGVFFSDKYGLAIVTKHDSVINIGFGDANRIFDENFKDLYPHFDWIDIIRSNPMNAGKNKLKIKSDVLINSILSIFLGVLVVFFTFVVHKMEVLSDKELGLIISSFGFAAIVLSFLKRDYGNMIFGSKSTEVSFISPFILSAMFSRFCLFNKHAELHFESFIMLIAIDAVVYTLILLNLNRQKWLISADAMYVMCIIYLFASTYFAYNVALLMTI